MTKSRTCPKCGGHLMYDDGDLTCLNCGHQPEIVKKREAGEIGKCGNPRLPIYNDSSPTHYYLRGALPEGMERFGRMTLNNLNSYFIVR